ncbi:CagY family CD-EC repeat-containing protein [Helicobacter pylori]
MEQQALDCLKNTKTEADRKECVKNLPKNLRKEILDKNKLRSL